MTTPVVAVVSVSGEVLTHHYRVIYQRLIGAQVSSEQITINVGRDLTLQSEQDSDRYDANSKRSASVAVTR